MAGLYDRTMGEVDDWSPSCVLFVRYCLTADRPRVHGVDIADLSRPSCVWRSRRVANRDLQSTLVDAAISRSWNVVSHSARTTVNRERRHRSSRRHQRIFDRRADSPGDVPIT